MCVCVCVCARARERAVCGGGVCVSGSCVCVCVWWRGVCVGGTCFFMPVFWLVLLWKCHEEAALSPAGGEKEGSPLPWTTGCSRGTGSTANVCLSVELGRCPFR